MLTLRRAGFFFFNDTATTEIYTLSLHDALPIYRPRGAHGGRVPGLRGRGSLWRDLQKGAGGSGTSWTHGRGFSVRGFRGGLRDRKSTRLNSSHANISYAVFCLKKKT